MPEPQIPSRRYSSRSLCTILAPKGYLPCQEDTSHSERCLRSQRKSPPRSLYSCWQLESRSFCQCHIYGTTAALSRSQTRPANMASTRLSLATVDKILQDKLCSAVHFGSRRTDRPRIRHKCHLKCFRASLRCTPSRTHSHCPLSGQPCNLNSARPRSRP